MVCCVTLEARQFALRLALDVPILILVSPQLRIQRIILPSAGLFEVGLYTTVHS
jgi:hypothetical protein